MPHLAQAGHRFSPAEGLLDAFADALGDRIAGMTGGTAVDRRTATAGVLRDTRRDRSVAQLHDKFAGVVAFVGPQRDRLWTLGMGLDQGQSSQPLGMTRSARGHCADNQTVAVLHQRVAYETQPCFFARSFAEET